MSRIVLLGGQTKSLINFRGPLISALAEAGNEVIAMADAATDAQVLELRALGAEFRAFTLRRTGLNPFGDLRTLIVLRRVMRDINPDLVLAYMIKPVIWGGLALRCCPNVRFFALITGLGYAFHGKGIVRRALTGLVVLLYKLSLQEAEGVFFQNSANRDLFVKRGIVPRRKTHIVNGSGVDLTQFSESGVPSGPVAFLMIARLLSEKGLREYAAAAEAVKKKFPEAIFRLVGPEDSSPDRISAAEAHGWQERGFLLYLGASEHVCDHLASCTVFVLPSYHEGMPRTVLEALATGRPVITTDVPGCRETVLPGENGFLVPARDASALADKMVWCIENSAELPRMGRRSRALAESRFDVTAVNRDMMSAMRLESR